jgi:hypothetical protein
VKLAKIGSSVGWIAMMSSDGSLFSISASAGPLL